MFLFKLLMKVLLLPIMLVLFVLRVLVKIGIELSWDVVLFDDNNNVMASTDITFNSVKGRYYYVGELNLDEDGKVLGGSPHYLSVLDQTLYDDGYCDEFFETLKTAEEAYEG